MNQIEQEPSFVESKKMKRIASLDFQRGLAIWLMVFLHVIEHVYDITWAYDLDKLFEKNIAVIGIVFLLAYLGSWAGYFLLISATVNSIAMTKKSSRDYSPEKILIKQIITGLGILIVAQITESFGYWGYFGYAIREPELWTSTYLIWSRCFIMETLHTIGWCMILNGVVHYFLMRKKGYQKFLRNIIIYGILVILIIVTTPFLWNFIDNLPWKAVDESILPAKVVGDLSTLEKWPAEAVQAANASFKTWILVIIAGDLEPLFPYLATSFIGSIAGLFLAIPEKTKRLPLIGGLTCLSLFIIGGILAAIGEVYQIELLYFFPDYHRPTYTYFFFTLGGQFGLMILLLWLVEYRGNPNKFANNWFVKYFRLWGIVALSVYSLQIFEMLPEWTIDLIFKTGLISGQYAFTNELVAIAVALYVILWFEILIRFWSKINFVGSFEWIIIHTASFGQQKISERLNVKMMMKNIEWISYKNKELPL